MNQTNRRTRKKEETRQRILRGAFKLFQQQDFERTTIDQITEAADIGKGTFYNYFASKEALVYDLVEQIGNERGKELWPTLVQLPSTRERLEKLTRFWTEWAESYPELMRVYMWDRVQNVIRQDSGLKPNHFEEYLARIFQLGQEAGEIRADVPVHRLVDYHLGIIMNEVNYWLDSGAGAGLASFVMRAVEFFFTGAVIWPKD